MLLDHPFLLGVLVLEALAVACWIGPGLGWMRATAITPGVVAACANASSGALNWMAGSPQHQIVSQRAAVGQLPFQVIEDAQGIDTVWELRARRPAGLLSEEWSSSA